MLRRAWLFALAACGNGGGSTTPTDDGPRRDGASNTEAPINVPGEPGLGAHGLNFYRLAVNSPTTISTTLATKPANSTIVVGVGRGNRYVHTAPTDNKGNATYQMQGQEQKYTRYQDSGTALYAGVNLTGGANHVVQTTTPSEDEITFAAVEVINGTRVQQVEWNEQLQAPLTSRSVTTTGPATLVAFWWGDAPEPQNKTAVPNNGFFVIDSILMSGALVQCAVAVKNVSAAGTYDVTWTATPEQGAQLWLIAIQ